jgi:hypothetical protein
MTIRTRVALRLAAILLLIGFVAVAHYELDRVQTLFNAERAVRARFYANVIRENWGCIKNTDQEKQGLLAMLDPDLPSEESEVMHLIAVLLLYGLLGSAVLNQAVSTYKLLSGKQEETP